MSDLVNGLFQDMVVTPETYLLTMPNSPQIVIEEQPVSRFRFRYDSEVGSHGSLMGESSDRRKKSYPRIKLLNYLGDVRIRVSLYTYKDGGSNSPGLPVRHVHKLQGKNCSSDTGVCEVTMSVTEENNSIDFPGIYIGHVAKKHISGILQERFSEETRKAKALNGWGVTDLTPDEQRFAFERAKQETKDMEKKLNSVMLCFEAEAHLPCQDAYVELCSSVFSNQINNQKAAATGCLKICRRDRTAGSVKGGEEMFILCEKVEKKNIKVRFFEVQDEGEVWEGYGSFNDFDVHHQYAIVLKTPEYRDPGISTHVTVKMELFRPSDGATSDSVDFTYIPDDDYGIKSKKRKTIDCPTTSSCFDASFNSCAFNPGARFSDRKPGGDLRLQMPDESTKCTDPLLTSNIVDDVNQLFEEHDRPGELIKLQERQMQITLNELNSGMDVVDGIGNIHIEPSAQMQQNPPPVTYTNSFDLNHLLEGGVTASFPSFDEDLFADGPGKQTSIQETKGTPVLVSRGTKASPTKTNSDTSRVDDDEPARNKNLTGDELAYRLAIQTAKALHKYARTSDIKHLLLTMRHLTAIPDENGDNAIHISVVHSQLNALSELVQIASTVPDLDPINTFNELIQTPLHIAVHIDVPAIVEALIKHGANANLLDRHGNTALHVAAQHGKPEIVKTLLNLKNYEGSFENITPSLDLLNYNGFAALHLAVLSNSTDCVMALCEAGCSVNVADGTSGRTALHLAVENKNKRILVTMLSQKSINVDCQAFNGNTPLHLACSLNLKDIVQLLVKAEADPYVENCDAVDETSSDDEEEKVECNTDDEKRGCNSFDMARDNKAILKMLETLEVPLASPPAPLAQSKTVEEKVEHVSKPILSRKTSDSGIYTDPIRDDGYETGPLKPSNLDSGLGGASAYDLLNETTRSKLAALLDPPGNKDWQQLSKHMQLDYLNFALEGAESPTLSLLTYIERLDDLQDGLKAICCREASTMLENFRFGGSKQSSSELTDKMSQMKIDP